MHHKYNTRGAESATMSDDLKIKPEFRDLIPKLTDEEFAQLEENILEAGEVKEPIIVWNGFIVDGHHRWYIIQKHPEIPYKIEEMDFEDEHAARAWAIRNQIGRRNLSRDDWEYLVGQRYREEVASEGAPKGNQHAKKQIGQNDQVVSGSSEPTAKRMAREYGIGERSVRRYADMAEGLDIADSIIPGMKETIRQRNIEVPKRIVQKIPKASQEEQRRAVELISEGDVHAAEAMLDGDGDIINSLHSVEDVQYSEDDLKQELEANFDKAMDSLRTTRETYYDLLGDPEVNNRIIDFLIELHEAEIIGLREEIING